MNSRIFLPLLLAAAATSNALGQEPIYTASVGFVKAGNVAADGGVTIDAVPPNTEVYLTVPLENPVEYSGLVDTVTPGSPTVINVQGTPGPGWVDDQWLIPEGSGAPYTVVVHSGTQNGVRGLVTGNTASGLEVVLPPLTGGDLDALASGDAITIRKAWTVKTFFEASNPPSQTTVLVYDENASGINQVAGFTTRFTYNGTEWKNLFNQTGDDTVLCPGETFVLRTGAVGLPSLTVFGDVPLSQFRIDLSKDTPDTIEEHLVASALPVPLFVGDLNLPAEEGDSFLYYDNAATGINKVSPILSRLTFTGGVWKNLFNQDVSASFVVSPGAGFRLRRAETSGNDVEWIQNAP